MIDDIPDPSLYGFDRDRFVITTPRSFYRPAIIFKGFIYFFLFHLSYNVRTVMIGVTVAKNLYGDNKQKTVHNEEPETGMRRRGIAMAAIILNGPVAP